MIVYREQLWECVWDRQNLVRERLWELYWDRLGLWIGNNYGNKLVIVHSTIPRVELIVNMECL